MIDADQSGAIDAEELQALLSSDLDEAAMTFKAFFSSVFELVYGWVPTPSEPQYTKFLQALFDQIATVASTSVYAEASAQELQTVPVYCCYLLGPIPGHYLPLHPHSVGRM